MQLGVIRDWIRSEEYGKPRCMQGANVDNVVRR